MMCIQECMHEFLSIYAFAYAHMYAPYLWSKQFQQFFRIASDSTDCKPCTVSLDETCARRPNCKMIGVCGWQGKMCGEQVRPSTSTKPLPLMTCAPTLPVAPKTTTRLISKMILSRSLSLSPSLSLSHAGRRTKFAR